MKQPMTPIKIAITIRQPRRKVWYHHLHPQSIQQWNQASPDWETTLAKVDLRVGGRFLSHMQAKDGSSGFDFEGTYTLVQPYRAYAYTMDDGRKVKVTFTSFFGITKVTVVFDPEKENPRQMQQEGWQLILNSFKKFLETH